jgi:hypothetical protein
MRRRPDLEPITNDRADPSPARVKELVAEMSPTERPRNYIRIVGIQAAVDHETEVVAKPIRQAYNARSREVEPVIRGSRLPQIVSANDA